MAAILGITIALLVAVSIAGIVTHGDGGEHEYKDVKMSELHEAIRDNPLKARETYEGTRIRVTGTLKDIDASGRSFRVIAYYKFLDCERIDCKVSNDEVRNVLSDSKDGEQVTVCGKVSRVDGTFGYAMRVESMER